MSVPKGFKQTEVGVIPKDWQVDEIQNLCSITTGDKNTQDRITGGPYPFFVRSQVVERINSYSFDGEAVLTAGDGVGTGKVFHYINGKFDFHQRVYKMSNFSSALSGYYFFQYFSNNFYNRISQMTAKSSVDSVRKEMIGKMLIPLPTPAEQTAIAAALSDMDALIEGVEKLLEKKRRIKQGAMQELLKLKEGWKEIRLDSVADIDNDNLSSSSDPDFVFQYISLEDVDNGILKGATEMMFKDAPSRARRRIKQGDVLISTVRPNLKSHLLVKENWKNYICSTGFSLVRCYKEKLSPGYLFNHLFASCINQQIDTVISGSNYPAINTSHVKSLKIPIPARIEEQEEIASILSDMDTEIQQLQTQLTKYRQLKTGMMQELLTGKKRLV